MAGGAQNARARLGAEKLAQVQRFITLDEQLLFRCGLHKIRFAPPPEPEEPAPDPAAAKASEKAQPAKAAPKPSPKPKPKPKPTSTDKGAPAAAKAQTATAPAPARKKPKVDDAYRPPAGTAAAPAASPVPRP
jgi:outer membrane biosynthesis protein TonB